MSAGSVDRPRLLVVGGCTGLIGRAVAEEFGAVYRIRSVHREPSPAEAQRGIETAVLDVAATRDWSGPLQGVDTVLTLAWYRQARRRRFVALADGLIALIGQAEVVGVRRFVHVSVPDAPAPLEAELPYLAEKRRVDRALEASRLDYAIVRPTMLFGRGDKLLTVMLRTARRYRRLPMFGDGEYHVSPIAVADLASILRSKAGGTGRSNIVVGGPRRYRYAELTAAIFEALHLPERYVRLSARGSIRLARWLELLGSSLLYEYEVEWLLADLLGVPPYGGLDRPMTTVEAFLADVVPGRSG